LNIGFRRAGAWLFIVFFCLQAFGAARVMGAQDKDRRQMVRFEGVLKDARGNPRTGVAGVNFALYKEQEGGPALWLETQNVELDEQGRYAVVLGTMKNEGVPMDWLATGEARWLGIQAYGQPEERVLLVRVPHDANALETVHAAPGIQPQPVSARELPANDNDNGAIHGRGTPGTIAKFTVRTPLETLTAASSARTWTQPPGLRSRMRATRSLFLRSPLPAHRERQVLPDVTSRHPEAAPALWALLPTE
jgi:hypothetical protein